MAVQVQGQAGASVPELDHGEGWPEPVPLRRGTELPAFPTDALPQWLADMVEATAEFTQTDPAMPATTAVSLLAAAAGGRLEVEVRPGWREPTNLFTATVAAPGERKTPVQAQLAAPLHEAEQRLVEDAKPAIAEAEAQREIAAQRATEAKRRAAKAADDKRDDATAEAISAELQAEAVTVPTLPRLLADDATPEAVSTLMAENAGKIAIVSDEGGIFDTLAGRYQAAPNLDAFLKGHAGSPLRVDRRGRAAEYVQKPALTVALMVQPELLRQVWDNLTFRGRGLLARFLLVRPTPMIGRRRVDPAPVPTDAAERYHERLRELAAALAEWTDPAVVATTDDARAVLMDYAAQVEQRLGAGGDLAHVADWGDKLVGATARLAGLLHTATHPEDCWRRPVAEHTVRGACRLGDFFAAHYLGSLAELGGDPDVDDAEYLLAVLDRHADELADGTVTARQLHVWASRSRFPTAKALQPALQVLVEHGWLAELPPPERSGPGRPPSTRYAVHPRATATETTETTEPP